jgi:hypothetical protein
MDADRRRVLVSAAAVLAMPLLGPHRAGAHLFHEVSEPPDNQLTRDYQTLVKLVDFPVQNFAMAREVYDGRQRVRMKPGGFRSWLRRPTEPGMVFKADWQLHRWTGTLAGECQRLDRSRGAGLDARVRQALAASDAGTVRGALREVFAYLIAELLHALERRLGDPEAAPIILAFASRYFVLVHEAWLNIHDRPRALVLRAALAAVERSLGDPARGIPPSPELFVQQGGRFVRMLGASVGARPERAT